MNRLALVFLVTALLTGCVTPPPNISNLTPVSNTRSFSLDQHLFWKQKLGPLATSEAELALAKGEYIAVHENEAGTLFRGPKQCVVVEIIGGYQITSGGVWVPKNIQEKLRLYTYAYIDQMQVRERNKVIEVISNPENSKVADQTNRSGVIVFESPVPISPIQAGAASGIATGIVNAMIASEIKENRGKPFLAWEVSEPTLEVLTRAKAKP